MKSSTKIRGTYRSKWVMRHKKATDYRRHPKHKKDARLDAGRSQLLVPGVLAILGSGRG
jgi:hypothetical protein